MPDPHPLPWLRWVALAWLIVYLPAYTQAYGVLNFLFLCNVGVILTAVGLVLGHPLLLSSQAVGAPFVCLAWVLDAGTRLLAGRHLFGGTEYLWDPRYPLFQRLLSLYHPVWPFVLLLALRRLGYDRRGWALQATIAAAALAASRAVDPALNLNFAHSDPLFHRGLGGAATHLLVVGGMLLGPIYGSTHALLRWGFREAPAVPPPH